MTFDRRTTALIDVAILVATIIIVSLVLVVGHDSPEEVPPDLAIGEPSPERFVANRSSSSIEDLEATATQQAAARNGEPEVFGEDNEATQTVLVDINAFFHDLGEGAFDEAPPPTTTTTTIEDTTTSSTEAPDESTTTTTTEPPPTTTTTLPRRNLEDQAAILVLVYPRLQESTIFDFVSLYNSDLDRVADGEASVFPQIEQETNNLARDELARGIKQDELNAVKDKYLSPLTRPVIFIPGLPTEELPLAREAISELVGQNLRVNLFVDDTAWQEAQDLAASSVAPVTTVYVFGETIVEQGEPLSSVQLQAITELQLYQPEVVPAESRLAMAILGTIAVLLAAFFLWRIAPAQWSQPRHFALLSILLILSALISKIPGVIATDNHALGYLMPAVAIGFLAAILFDPRTAVLLSVPMAGFTAISTQDLGWTLYAGIAVVIPVAFVSSVASRRQLRVAVVLVAAAVTPVAASVEWLFGAGQQDALQGAGWAALGALGAGLVALGLVSFLETAFRITTTLTLLDLLDRNHPALRLLEEQAPGTFNHSMLVGSLAGRAARAIDADSLLAQAAAWYHDLGKTENPQYFVENQFGVSNPHDDLPPEKSVEIIRTHVTDGLRLARQYRIPGDVADGIPMHHGTSLMRFFYHKALEQDAEVDPMMFRHRGKKPERREMAIVMISDAVEGAARAYSQEEDPTGEGLEKLVDTVVSEKLDDGQLDHSDLTFGDLTAVKQELVRALMGYYHARVPYPGFPGPRVESPA